MRRGKLSSDFYTKTKSENDVVEIHVPTLPILYKYQPVTEYSLSNFEHDEIWGTAPVAFNDPYDCTICYSRAKFENAIRNRLSPEKEKIYKKYYGLTRKEDLIKRLAHDICEQDSFKRQYIVSCFSVNNDSEIMWAHYADAAKGFCLAYEGNALMEAAKKSSQSLINCLIGLGFYNGSAPTVSASDCIMPIIYDDRKANATDQLIEAVPYGMKYIDVLLGLCSPAEAERILGNDYIQMLIDRSQKNRHVYQNMICRKNKVWEYEQEWRIISHNENIYRGDNNNTHMRIGNVVAGAVYLGERMPEYNRRVVIGIARSKNIPIYEMRSEMYSHNFRLKSYPINS